MGSSETRHKAHGVMYWETRVKKIVLNMILVTSRGRLTPLEGKGMAFAGGLVNGMFAAKPVEGKGRVSEDGWSAQMAVSFIATTRGSP